MGSDRQPEGRRIRAVAALAGLKLDISPDYVHFQTNKTDAFKEKFPSGRVPCLEGKDGLWLFESIAITRYIANLAPEAHLLGRTPKETALVDQWVSFASHEIAFNNNQSFLMVHHWIKPYVKAIDQEFRTRQLRSLATLESHLESHTFLVGERITIADITVVSILQRAFSVIFDKPTREAHPNIVRFYETVVNQPAVKDIFGETEYIDKPLAYTPPPKDEKKA
ncbi:glutathione S-transferase C-terminal-like protein [Sistotremastrum niveocremeum HHB9708]|uniref:Glutathione S-transferase C-terminal-like protein n=1 Tax=Sistotremastrum niveocremeum HHB9708 TaxID=1314777 RepID=A0A164P1L5_9AGAM|nr:glutathione S-transferase C-terminal-like protein [Sistotremastrum niveocremeum HHB9708]